MEIKITLSALIILCTSLSCVPALSLDETKSPIRICFERGGRGGADMGGMKGIGGMGGGMKGIGGMGGGFKGVGGMGGGFKGVGGMGGGFRGVGDAGGGASYYSNRYGENSHRYGENSNRYGENSHRYGENNERYGGSYGYENNNYGRYGESYNTPINYGGALSYGGANAAGNNNLAVDYERSQLYGGLMRQFANSPQGSAGMQSAAGGIFSRMRSMESNYQHSYSTVPPNSFNHIYEPGR